MFSRRGPTPPAGPPAPPPRRSRLLGGLARAFGLASLAYIAGAAVIYFDLPTSTFLRRALGGAVAWYESREVAPEGGAPAAPVVGAIDKPGRTFDGFTLCMYGGHSQAVLLDMRGQVVHRWHVPFSKLWPAPDHVKGRVRDADVYFNDGFVYPNGDLLAIVEGPISATHPSNGLGLVKLDKDSNVLWKYAEWCHHDLDVGDDGTIYVLVNEVAQEVPRGLDHIPTPCIVDAVDILSPDGQRRKRVRLLEAFHNSLYAPLLGVLERPSMTATSLTGPTASAFREDELRRDVLHANAVKVLNPRLAAAFPQFQPGQLLVCPRNLDAIAVVDPDTEKVVWAARGAWHAQHDPTFLENGHILLFDNLGCPARSRVLEYDPKTQAFPWVYPPPDGGRSFVSRIRGMCQRLPNGNTLVVNSVGGEALEVAPDGEVVWSVSTAPVTLNRARRYAPDRLEFLKGGPRARP